MEPVRPLLNRQISPTSSKRYVIGILIGFAFYYAAQAFFFQFGSYYLFAGIGEGALVLIGLVGGLPTLVGLSMVNVWGALSDRYQRRIPFMLLGFTAQAIAFLIYLLITNTFLFLLMTCLAYLFSTAALPLANAFLTEAQTGKGGAVGLLLATNSLGWAIGSIGSGFLYDFIGMHGLFLLGAGLFFIGGIVILSLVRELPFQAATQNSTKEPPPLSPPSTPTSPANSVNRFLVILLIAVCLGNMGVNAFSFFLGLYLISEIGGIPIMVGLANGVGSLIGLTVALTAGYFSDRVGRKPILLLGFGGWSVFLVVYATVTNPWIATILWMIPIYPMIYTGSYSVAADVSSFARRGRAMTYINTAQSLGVGIGPIIGGTLVQLVIGTLRINMLLGAGLNTIGLFLIMFGVPETVRYLNRKRDNLVKT